MRSLKILFLYIQCNILHIVEWCKSRPCSSTLSFRDYFCCDPDVNMLNILEGLSRFS